MSIQCVASTIAGRSTNRIVPIDTLNIELPVETNVNLKEAKFFSCSENRRRTMVCCKEGVKFMLKKVGRVIGSFKVAIKPGQVVLGTHSARCRGTKLFIRIVSRNTILKHMFFTNIVHMQLQDRYINIPLFVT